MDERRKGHRTSGFNAVMNKKARKAERSHRKIEAFYDDGEDEQLISEEERKHRQWYQERIIRMKREKERQRLQRRMVIGAVALVLVAVIAIGSGIMSLINGEKNSATAVSIEAISQNDTNVSSSEASIEPEPEPVVFEASKDDSTTDAPSDVVSSHAVLVDMNNDKIVYDRLSDEKIFPASMTKVLTVLVAAENLSEEDLNKTYTMDITSTDYSFSNDCSNVGFEVGEQVSVKDLFYGTILCSGADAAVGLATYVAGSQDAFVELMNQKLDELGLSDTAHFTNCVGVYNDDHYCTVYDMAMIMEAAMNNDLCKEVLSTHTYTTSLTTEHPDGITISNWFLRRIEDKDSGATVMCGKTGFVVQSGNCAVSYAEDSKGNGYVCVTNGSTSALRCIYDHVSIYSSFFGISSSSLLDSSQGESTADSSEGGSDEMEEVD